MSRPLVTVNTLTTQVREQGRITLPAAALITPAAADWLQSTRLPIERIDGAPATEPSAPTTWLIGDAGNPYIQTLVTTLERTRDNIRFLSCDNRRDLLLDHIRTLSENLAGCSERRGVIVVDKGAIAACVVNKHAHIRAAILQQPSDLFALQRELGLNVLVIEMSRTSLHQARGAIDTFLRGTTQIDPRIEAVLTGVGAAATEDSCTRCAL